MKTKLLFLLPMLAVLFAACKKDSKNEPNQKNGTENGHEWVDLGLSVKWATCNVGASTPEGYGDYFAWGETIPKTTYNWSTYKYCKGSSDTMTKYCTSSSFCAVDNKTVLDLEDDAAHVNWGGNWRMPTTIEQHELMNNCTWTWTTQNGVNGYLVTGKNGISIFLPAAGHYYVSDCLEVSFEGVYWSSSLSNNSSSGTQSLAYVVRFDSKQCQNKNGGSFFRYQGVLVRPVCQ